MGSDENLEIPYGGTMFMPDDSFGLLSEGGCGAFAYRLTKEGPHELEQTVNLAMRINDMMSKQGGAVLAYHYDGGAEDGSECSLLLTSELPLDVAQCISKLGFGFELIKQGHACMKDNPDGTIGGYIKLC